MTPERKINSDYLNGRIDRTEAIRQMASIGHKRPEEMMPPAPGKGSKIGRILESKVHSGK